MAKIQCNALRKWHFISNFPFCQNQAIFPIFVDLVDFDDSVDFVHFGNINNFLRNHRLKMDLKEIMSNQFPI